MAIRYSGDVEVRLQHTTTKLRGPLRSKLWEYRVSVRDPVESCRLTIHLPARTRTPTDPSSYDAAAEEALLVADRVMRTKRGVRLQFERRAGRPFVRRLFQAPCPT